MRKLSKGSIRVLPLAALVAAALAWQAAPASASTTCPGGFLVFQPVPAGPVMLLSTTYTITVINNSCDSAVRKLQSFIGQTELPAPWTADPATKTFRNGLVQFSLSAPGLTAAGPGGTPRCPHFTLTRRDRFGRVRLPRGNYAVEPLGDESFDCQAAARLLVEVVEERGDRLPGAWTATATHGDHPGALLSRPDGRELRFRWLDGRTAGGGHTSP
jgi:hypothetical protein